MSRTSTVRATLSRRGTHIKATGSAAQALFDAMCAGIDKSKPAATPDPSMAPAPAEPAKLPIGPLDV